MAGKVSHTGIDQPPELLQRLRPRRVEADSLALYRDGAPQLLVEEVLAVAEVARLGGDGVGDVLDGLGVVQLVRDPALLGVWLAVRRDGVLSVGPLHACDCDCDCAHTAGAGRVDDAWHRLLVVADWVG